jgi:cell division protein FtsL
VLLIVLLPLAALLSAVRTIQMTHWPIKLINHSPPVIYTAARLEKTTMMTLTG